MVNLVASTDAVRRTEFPRAVRAIDHQWIEMSDGIRLAARLWLPEDAEARPVPAIVEYIPYRHRDFTLPRDQLIHPWFAGHGYAAVRLDVRGSGNSEGAPMDEYASREQDDMIEALAWIAAQPWCTGACGMIGISWGGFSALQTAFRRPRELRAVIALCATDDRYADDVHYMSGCLLRNNLAWGGQAQAYAARPPDPAVVGDAWRPMWRERLDKMPFYTAEWLSHQRRDDYWKHGSVCEDWSAVGCPVYAVTGWADGYTNAALRLMSGLKVPRRCLIGPWAHGYPHLGVPGPAIGFLQECLRWWDRWLKDVPNGIDAEPMVRMWLQDPAPPATACSERPGRWIAEETWPSPGVARHVLGLDASGRLTDGPGCGSVPLSTDLTVGMMTGEWNPHGIGPELPGDQRHDDARSLAFDGPAMTDDLAIVGAPRLHLRVRSDNPLAVVVARLTAVAPDGASCLVTWGCCNLAHRNGHELPAPMEPGAGCDVVLDMNVIAQVVRAGHRLRLALSTGSWPLLWPAPEQARLEVDCAASTLVLPVRRPGPLDALLAPFGRAETSPAAELVWLRPFSRSRRFVTDVGSGRTEFVLDKDDGAFRIAGHGMEIDQLGRERQAVDEGMPLSARGESFWRIAMARGEWRTSVEAETTLSCDARHFFVRTRVMAREGDRAFAVRSLDRTIARDLI